MTVKAKPPEEPKMVRVRATRSFDLMDEGEQATVELEPFIEVRIAAGYLEVVWDASEDTGADGPGGAAEGTGG